MGIQNYSIVFYRIIWLDISKNPQYSVGTWEYQDRKFLVLNLNCTVFFDFLLHSLVLLSDSWGKLYLTPWSLSGKKYPLFHYFYPAHYDAHFGKFRKNVKFWYPLFFAISPQYDRVAFFYWGFKSTFFLGVKKKGPFGLFLLGDPVY